MRRAAGSLAIAVVTVAAATITRSWLDEGFESGQVFSLYYMAVAITAYYAGLRPALVAILLGGVAADWFFLEPRASLFGHDAWLAIPTYALVSMAITACIEGIRRASRQTVRIAAESSELLAVADAVRVHGIRSRELMAYLEGLNAGPDTLVAAAKYDVFDLEPDELAARLEAAARKSRESTVHSA